MNKKQIESFINHVDTVSYGKDRNGNQMYRNGDQLMITGKGRLTEGIYAVTTTLKQYQKWQSGVYAQTAFSDLSPTQREFIMTGNTDEDWKAMFGDPDAPEDDEEEDLEPEPAF